MPVFFGVTHSISGKSELTSRGHSETSQLSNPRVSKIAKKLYESLRTLFELNSV